MQNYHQHLMQFDPEKIHVWHVPMTPRYKRAFPLREQLVRQGIYLGHRQGERQTIEVAVFQPNPNGKHKPGRYANFRLSFDAHGEVQNITLFCFYDGTDESPSLKSLEKAMALAKQHGFGGRPP